MIYPLVDELAGAGIPVTVTCRVLNIARQPFYRWKQHPLTDAAWVRAHRVNALVDAHQEDPEFGWTAEGKLYCCAMKDVYANRIVGYSISDRMTAQLAVDALENAVARRGDVAGCIVHADRGSQFRSRRMAAALNRHGMVGSMGRVASAGDNAAMESFWSLLQKNVLNQRSCLSRQDLRLAIVIWIERKYHRQRPQDALGGLTPIEFEAKLTPAANLAA